MTNLVLPPPATLVRRDNVLLVESLGAGTQSSALGLMSAWQVDGMPKLDAAVFSDTGWEPAEVYEHLSRLEDEMTRHGIKVFRVTAGNIRKDHLEPEGEHLFIRKPRKYPHYLGKQRTFIPVYLETTRGGERYHGDDVEDESAVEEVEPGVFEVRTPLDPEVDAAMRLLAEKEPYALAEHVVEALFDTGSTDEVRRIDTRPRVEKGIARRTCTKTYKIEPVEKQIRELLGLVPRQTWPTDLRVEQWFGITYDEMQRMSTSPRPAIEHRYPLVEMRMTREDCITWLEENGWPGVPRSACIGCPFHSDEEWRRIRDDHPDQWADAIEFDETFRARQQAGLLPMEGTPYLHASRLPLRDAPIDLAPTAAQESLFGETCEGFCGT